jgi:SAM-dependent methyltransferase
VAHTAFSRRIRRLLRRCDAPVLDLADHHISTAVEYAPIRGASVLVAGCNTGDECRRFVERGAAHVVGVDVIDEIGSEFDHPRVEYVRSSIEHLDLPDSRFDLVYCFATMEHVARIDLGFRELVRVARPGGVVYVVAAPLWHSRVGHHKSDIFNDHPWIHLRLSRDEIVTLCRRQGIDTHVGIPIETHVDYMLSDAYFNKVAALEYVAVCAGLAGVDVLVNSLAYDEDDDLTPNLEAELAARGFSREELLASVHTLVGRRR